MDIHLLLKIFVLLIGFYMAWNIGANDVSNAMGTSVGSGALTLWAAVIIAAIFEFTGAVFLGNSVSETMQDGILNLSLFQGKPILLAKGMCAALLGTGLWLQMSSLWGLPVSTTHAITGAIAGFGFLQGGVHGVQWDTLSYVASMWVFSPVISGTLSYFLFLNIQKNILFKLNPEAATRRQLPTLIFFIFSTFTFSILTNGIHTLKIHFSLTANVMIACLVGLFTSGITYLCTWHIKRPFSKKTHTSSTLSYNLLSLEKTLKHLYRIKNRPIDPSYHNKISALIIETKKLMKEMKKANHHGSRSTEFKKVEGWFSCLQIISACFIAFAHGANDVANVIGPIAAVFGVLDHGVAGVNETTPIGLLLFGGVGIVLGLATWGWRVIETIGKRITELTPSRGFCAEFGASLTILFASKIGIPISTTHCLVGSVLGVGVARGLRGINLKTLKGIVFSWICTIPASAVTTILCFYFIDKITAIL